MVHLTGANWNQIGTGYGNSTKSARWLRETDPTSVTRSFDTRALHPQMRRVGASYASRGQRC